MNRVKIEIWFGLGKELGKDFESPSEIRSIRDERIGEGETIGQLLDRMARRYPPIARDIFDIREKRLYHNVVVNYNDRIISPYEVYETNVKNGDKIIVLPIFPGG